MPEYNPAKKAYDEGRSTVTAEEAVGLRGKMDSMPKKKSILRRLASLIRRKKIVKPTPEEQKLIDERLARMYPRRYGRKPIQKPYESVRTKAVSDSLKTIGLTEAEINRLKGKK